MWCASLMRRRATSFYLATRFLPADKRRAIEALYGFCRFTDDVADEPGLTRNEREQMFTRITAAIDALAEGTGIRPAELPWIPALQWAAAAYAIDLREAQLLVRGCRSDLIPARFASLDELERYADAVAGTVGRTVMVVLGARDGDSLERAGRLGIAMQITNVLRDLEEDAAMGRRYVPASAPGELREAFFLVAGTARRYYREAKVLAARIPNDGSRVALLSARGLYEGILDRIEERNFMAGGRAYVSATQKMGFIARSLLQAYSGRATMR
jgi:phytoene synthase